MKLLQVLRSNLKNLAFVALVALAFTLPALAAKTTLSPSEILNKLSGRENIVPYFVMDNQPSSGTLGGFIADRNYRLRGMSFTVGGTLGTGATSVRLEKNGVTVTGSALSVAAGSAAFTTKRAGLDVAVSAGDVIVVHLTNTTTTTKSNMVGVRVDFAESYD